MGPRDKDDAPGLRRLHGDVDRLLLDLLRSGRAPRQGPAAFSPNADIFYCHREKSVVVRLELPGIDPDRITLEIEGNLLRVGGVRSDQYPPDAVYHQMEISYGRFERVISLPPEVDITKAVADYAGGYLEIRLPIKQRSAARQIVITPSGEREEGEKQ